ncbi:MAG TPA: FlgD immunoglobulin-like domain containing protein, partial [bacterium]|nr:FlgD immunoglobulin-like domain containing protein [bacterium]
IKQHHFTYIQTDGKTLTLRAINKEGETIDLHSFDKNSTKIGGLREIAPEAYALHANYPNPFNGTTVIPFAMQKEEAASLAIYDLHGRLVKQLIRGKVGPGLHTITWDGTDASGRQAASGVYLVRLHTPSFQQTRQAVYLK